MLMKFIEIWLKLRSPILILILENPFESYFTKETINCWIFAFLWARRLARLEREDQVSRALFKPRARSFYIYISNTKPRGGMNQNQGKWMTTHLYDLILEYHLSTTPPHGSTISRGEKPLLLHDASRVSLAGKISRSYETRFRLPPGGHNGGRVG